MSATFATRGTANDAWAEGREAGRRIVLHRPIEAPRHGPRAPADGQGVTAAGGRARRPAPCRLVVRRIAAGNSAPRDRHKPSAADVSARYKKVLFPSAATYYEEPVALESGKGPRVRDFDGRSYLDFFGGILTVGVGHAHPRVNAAVHAQVDRLGHVSALYPTLPSSNWRRSS